MSGAGTAGRTARYVPGAGNVVLRGDVLVALPYAPAERAAAVWDALDGAAGVMDALQVLSATFDAGLAALPPFAVVVLTSGGRAHVLVRGDVEVHVDGRDGRTELHGRDVSTWTERAVEGVDGVRVRLGASSGSAGDADAGPTTLPLVGGVVRAKAVIWGSPTWAQDASAGTDAEDAPPTVALAKPEPAEDPAAQAEEPAAPTDATAGPGDVPQAVPGLVTAVPGLPAFVPTTPPAPAAGEVVGTVEVPSELTLAPMETIAPGADVPDAPAADVPDAPAADAVGPGQDEGSAEPPPEDAMDAGDDYQSLWETTIHRSVEEAAVRVDEAEESGEGAPSTGAEPSPGGLVSGVPQDLPSASAPADPDGPDGFDHDGHTVMGSSVSDLRAVAAAAAAQLAASGELPAFSAPPTPPAPSGAPAATPGEQPVVGPQLVARLCVSGHANPPSRERCAVCGLALSGETRAVARPALGRVRVTIGEGGEPQVFPLDRPLVVGRRPRSPKGANPGGNGALHRIVTVPSPQQDISRSHVEVRLEGWNVLAVDLNTTNGTTLLRPGQSPLRMHPGDPLLVVSGDVVDLGDGVALAFEDVP